MKLTIHVEPLTEAELSTAQVQLMLQSKRELHEGRWTDAGLQFECEIGEGRDGKPNGEAIHWHGDKRRFIYLAWYSLEGGLPTMFKRIKLYLDQFLDLDQPLPDTAKVTVSSRDAKGEWACSTAKLLP